MNELLNQLESKINFFDKRNSKVSTETVGWQIAHSLKVISQIVAAVKNSDTDDYKWTFNKSRFLISITGFFPRGKARAPKSVLPDISIDKSSLENNLQEVREVLKNWPQLNENANFQHPFFGNLNKKSTEWFLKLHTKHHLKIINDICKIKQ